MFEINTLHIESPWFFLLIPVVIVAVVMAFYKKSPSLMVSTLEPYRRSIKTRQRLLSPIKVPLIVESFGLLCLVAALVRPQHGIEETIRRTEGIDIMLALDVSGSMEAYDIPRVVRSDRELQRMFQEGRLRPRIDVAKEEVTQFIDRRPNDRMGIVAFSANTYTVCPPTLDHPFLKSHLARLKAGMLTDGTGIAAPIAISTNRLKESKAKRRVLVLFTDGDNNVEAKVTPIQAAKIAGMFDVIIHTVGIGSNRAFAIRQGFFGRQQMVSAPGSFNEELLRGIAAETGGRYFEAEDATGLRDVMNEIDELEKTSLEQPTFIDYKELYRNWLYGGIVLLILAYILEQTWCLKVP